MESSQKVSLVVNSFGLVAFDDNCPVDSIANVIQNGSLKYRQEICDSALIGNRIHGWLNLRCQPSGWVELFCDCIHAQPSLYALANLKYG